MQNYIGLVQDVMDNGIDSDNRTDQRSKKVTGRSLRFNLLDGTIPIVTTRYINVQALVGELVGFIRGVTNYNEFKKLGCNFWYKNGKNANWINSPNRNEEGDLGPIYGGQWRNYAMPDGSFKDQLMDAIKEVRDNPNSRRIIVMAWNPGVNDTMCLPPCHIGFQLIAYPTKKKLDMVVTIRSSDVFLGLPYNIASYAILLRLIAELTQYDANDLVINTHDTHIYENHMVQCANMVVRQPYDSPILIINAQKLNKIIISDMEDLSSITPEDFNVLNYVSHPPLFGTMAD